MTRFIQWLILSSKDPGKISLSVKGFGLMLVPILITIGGLTSIQIPDQQGLESIIEGIAAIVQIVFGIVSAIVTIYGIIRKIMITLKGENKVIEAQRESDL